MQTVPAITAAAAILAAVFSGLTVYVSGRRETRRWLRDSLLEAEVEFLDASFKYPARQLFTAIGDLELGALPSTVADLPSFLPAYSKAHDAQNDALTRIRLLAGRQVVEAAEDLHDLDEHTSLVLLENKPFMGGTEYADRRAAQRRAREQFINSARADLKLSTGATIRSSDVNRDRSLPISGGL